LEFRTKQNFFLPWIWRSITPENPAERPRVHRDQPTQQLCGPSTLEKSEMRTRVWTMKQLPLLKAPSMSWGALTPLRRPRPPLAQVLEELMPGPRGSRASCCDCRPELLGSSTPRLAPGGSPCLFACAHHAAQDGMAAGSAKAPSGAPVELGPGQPGTRGCYSCSTGCCCCGSPTFRPSGNQKNSTAARAFLFTTHNCSGRIVGQTSGLPVVRASGPDFEAVRDTEPEAP
jgi:hypothetical protein